MDFKEAYCLNLSEKYLNDYKEARTNADFTVINGTVEDYEKNLFNL